MPAMRDHIQAYVQRPEKQRLQREAAARGISVSQCVIDCLREYFAWREEMAAAIDNPGRPGDQHQGGPIQVLLARTESRLATTLDARFRDLIANRRYRNWRRTVQRLVRSGTTNGDSAAQLSFDVGAEA